MEEHAWIIDYLPQGRASESRREAIVQMLGHQFFTLLEATVKPEAQVSIGQKVYIGKEQRNEIERIKGKLAFSQLTQNAKDNLVTVLKSIVVEREADFVAFMNKAAPISMRVHQLELLPGVGKKHLEALLTEREKKPFDNFADLRARIHSIPDPAILFVHRILNELEGKEKHYLFLQPFSMRSF
jgi:putative nucleotide binding protein